MKMESASKTRTRENPGVHRVLSDVGATDEGKGGPLWTLPSVIASSQKSHPPRKHGEASPSCLGVSGPPCARGGKLPRLRPPISKHGPVNHGPCHALSLPTRGPYVSVLNQKGIGVAGYDSRRAGSQGSRTLPAA